jgi:hypothetical protein
MVGGGGEGNLTECVDPPPPGREGVEEGGVGSWCWTAAEKVKNKMMTRRKMPWGVPLWSPVRGLPFPPPRGRGRDWGLTQEGVWATRQKKLNVGMLQPMLRPTFSGSK